MDLERKKNKTCTRVFLCLTFGNYRQKHSFSQSFWLHIPKNVHKSTIIFPFLINDQKVKSQSRHTVLSHWSQYSLQSL